ncbi:SDR family NAD(P)-dependent oxidoreductase [Fodinicola acaciae]|uniref:SDR family NAD(P)-dependent oxidoreductase n=1 Tax=Fodinicola acaciae TaxID=2681555 RepID=UPI0013D3266C|nr:SDR family oxidoreductase [Fodinicola acaciae]
MPRNIVVTGGGTGIGRAVAAAFTAAGDHVVITGRRQDVLERTAKELGVEAIVCDHTDVDQIAALAAAVDSVDVLVNNAGGNTEMTNDEPTDLAGLAAAWRRQLEANLLSAVLTTEALSDRLASGGAVVHIGSIAADKGAAGYGAAKAGLASYNVGLARELGPRGITSNVVSPGYIGDTEFFADRMTDARRTTLVEATFVGRAGAPEDIAGTVFYLASPGARYVTGQTIAVNGGAWPSR